MSINPIFLSDTVVLETMTDKIMYGLQTTLLGMGVVFAVLIILWAVLGVFKLVFFKSDTKGEKASAPAPAPAPAAVSEPELTPIYNEPDDAELVAVITAAIASMMDQPQTSFRVVSFRRTAKK
ncbi:MAG: OadG family protein [Clostridia bacterium]|nr:OadG family protein [Clostridia bacterium]